VAKAHFDIIGCDVGIFYIFDLIKRFVFAPDLYGVFPFDEEIPLWCQQYPLIDQAGSVVGGTLDLIDEKDFPLGAFVGVVGNGVHQVGVVHQQFVRLGEDAVASGLLVDHIDQAAELQIVQVFHKRRAGDIDRCGQFGDIGLDGDGCAQQIDQFFDLVDLGMFDVGRIGHIDFKDLIDNPDEMVHMAPFMCDHKRIAPLGQVRLEMHQRLDPGDDATGDGHMIGENRFE